MRYSGILILAFLIFEGCKTASVTSSKPAEYKESLAELRPNLAPEANEAPEETEPLNESKVPFTNSLKIELDSANQKIIARNATQQYVDGFTIQIYTGNNRDDANSAQSRAVELDPALNPTITYYQPSYKVKIGQFSDRLEAHEMFMYIKKEFPKALLIPERIKIQYD